MFLRKIFTIIFVVCAIRVHGAEVSLLPVESSDQAVVLDTLQELASVVADQENISDEEAVKMVLAAIQQNPELATAVAQVTEASIDGKRPPSLLRRLLKRKFTRRERDFLLLLGGAGLGILTVWGAPKVYKAIAALMDSPQNPPVNDPNVPVGDNPPVNPPVVAENETKQVVEKNQEDTTEKAQDTPANDEQKEQLEQQKSDNDTADHQKEDVKVEVIVEDQQNKNDQDTSNPPANNPQGTVNPQEQKKEEVDLNLDQNTEEVIEELPDFVKNAQENNNVENQVEVEQENGDEEESNEDDVQNPFLDDVNLDQNKKDELQDDGIEEKSDNVDHNQHDNGFFWPNQNSITVNKDADSGFNENKPQDLPGFGVGSDENQANNNTKNDQSNSSIEKNTEDVHLPENDEYTKKMQISINSIDGERLDDDNEEHDEVGGVFDDSVSGLVNGVVNLSKGVVSGVSSFFAYTTNLFTNSNKGDDHNPADDTETPVNNAAEAEQEKPLSSKTLKKQQARKVRVAQKEKRMEALINYAWDNSSQEKMTVSRQEYNELKKLNFNKPGKGNGVNLQKFKLADEKEVNKPVKNKGKRKKK